MDTTLGFFTQYELDAVVGYPRRRQRLIASGLLPRGERVKAYGQETIVFPEFATAALVVDRPTPQDAALLRHVLAAAERLYAAPSFAAMSAVLRVTLRKGWRLDDLAGALIDGALEALTEWRGLVKNAERHLAHAGIRFRIDYGRVEEVSETGYRVALPETGDIISVAANAIRATLPVGAWVTRDLIELGARTGEVLVPTVAPGLLASVPETDDAIDTASWNELFRNATFEPVAVPTVRDAGVEADSARGDLLRPRRRLSVHADRGLYANANTMARESATHRSP